MRLVVVSSLPHAWVLQHASLAIHQGSAAATQAAMRAGVPSVAFPAFGEQHFWAGRVSALGVGPAVHFPLREAVARLDECVGVARQPGVVAAAAQVGERLRAAGDGAQAAALTVRDVLNRPQHRHCGVVCRWEADDSRADCSLCAQPFSLLNRRRHCRSCGRLACARCLVQRCHLPGFPENAPQITCERCLDHRRAYFAKSVGEAVVPALPGEAGRQAAAVTPAAQRGGGAAAMASPQAAEFEGVDLIGRGAGGSVAKSTPVSAGPV
jgi:hypothetical protein